MDDADASDLEAERREFGHRVRHWDGFEVEDAEVETLAREVPLNAHPALEAILLEADLEGRGGKGGEVDEAAQARSKALDHTDGVLVDAGHDEGLEVVIEDLEDLGAGRRA